MAYFSGTLWGHSALCHKGDRCGIAPDILVVPLTELGGFYSWGCSSHYLVRIGLYLMDVYTNVDITDGYMFIASLGMTQKLLFSYFLPCVGILPEAAS